MIEVQQPENSEFTSSSKHLRESFTKTLRNTEQQRNQSYASGCKKTILIPSLSNPQPKIQDKQPDRLFSSSLDPKLFHSFILSRSTQFCTLLAIYKTNNNQRILHSIIKVSLGGNNQTFIVMCLCL